MLTHPNIRLRPLELLALNQITELLPRILEQSLLDLRNDKNNLVNFKFNKDETVHFKFKKKLSKPKYILVDSVTKEQVSQPLYTLRQVGFMLNVQKISTVRNYLRKKGVKISPVLGKKVKIYYYHNKKPSTP
jgi:hypothetical protein